MIACSACELVAAPLLGGLCPNNQCPRHTVRSVAYDKAFALAHPYSLLSWAQGYTLWQAAKRAPLEGDFAELGTYWGGSALILHLADEARRLHLFDTFQGHPPLHDARHDRPGSHQAGTLGDTSVEAVLELLGRHGATAQAYVGIFPESIEDLERDVGPFACVHVDVDLWKSARDALAIFFRALVPGGILVMDDYGTDECPGVWEAVEEFACTHEGQVLVERSTYPTYQAVLTKVVVE